MQLPEIRIGTRGSPLALAQAEETRSRLGGAASVTPIKTTGDRITDRPLTEAGGKGLFTKEIDEALLSGSVDIGVHSAKDLPTRLPEGLVIAACLPRADARDAFISKKAETIEDLPRGAVLGTSSLRRKALALKLRPDLRVVDMRGNVETRLRKLEAGEADATLLALAGLARLGLQARATSILDPASWIPAVGQGIIAVVARENDDATRRRLAAIADPAAALALEAERAFLDVLDGSCRTPIGGHARVVGDELFFHGIIVKPDGSACFEVERMGAAAGAGLIGTDAARDLVRRGGAGFFAG